MFKRKVFAVAVIALSVLVESSVGLGINIFGKKDANVKDDSSADEGLQKQETPRPPLISIPRPEDHPLHHNNDPNHPFNNMPTLGGTRSTIVATKTVYVEVTSTITQHPICIEVHGVKPPCLPHHGYGHGYESNYGTHQEYGYHNNHNHNYGFEAGFNGYFREGGQEIDQIQPTATLEMLEPTRILGGVSETVPAPSEYQDDEDVEEGETRNARYLKIHSATPSVPVKTESEIDETPEDSDENKARLLEGLINRQPEYHYATKTLWVTKVQKYVDHKVTATLLIQNCIPNEFHYPFCHKKEHYETEHSSHHYKPVHHESGHVSVHHESGHVPVHHKPVHHESVHHESYHHEPVHHETYHHEPVHHEPVHHEPVHHEPVHHEPVHHEPVHHESTHHEPVHHEPAHHEPVHHEPVHHEPVLYKPVHHETVHKPIYHETVQHKPTYHESVHHKPVHHEQAYKPVHETYHQDLTHQTHHNAHEYPQPVHVETHYIPGHEISFQGSTSLSGGLSTNFKANGSQAAVDEQSPKSS